MRDQALYENIEKSITINCLNNKTQIAVINMIKKADVMRDFLKMYGCLANDSYMYKVVNTTWVVISC